MNYEEAKAKQKDLDDKYMELSRKLCDFPHEGLWGLPKEVVRLSTEYQEAKKQAGKAFQDLRNFNFWFIKNFRKEIKQERRNKG